MLAIRRVYDRILEVIAALLMAALTVTIVLGFGFRAVGLSLVWYDEIASIGLCWLTYYASVLAALRGAHMGFAGIVNAFPPSLRVASTIVAELIVIAFFVILAVTGLEVLDAIQGTTLVSIPSVSLVVTQSVIPVTAVLFIIAELLRFPETLAAARGAGFEDQELKEALESVNAPTTAGGAAR